MTSLKNKISSNVNQFKIVWKRIKTKDFSGESGQALNNSKYMFLTSIVSESAAIIFSIIIARILMPNLFGLYSLTLSTLLIFIALSNLGFQETLITFLSNEIKKGNDGKTWSLIKYLGKMQLITTLIVMTIIVLSANLISNNVYNKPITLGLIVGVFYLALVNLSVFLQAIFISFNNVKKVFYKEIIFQSSRLLIVPIGILLLIKNSSDNLILFIIFFSLILCYILTDGYMLISVRKHFLTKNKDKFLDKSDKKTINKFFISVSTIALSGLFFSYIDKIVLGHFVTAEAIGYYSAAFGIIGSIAGLITFGIVLLPIFSQAKEERLKGIMHKSLKGVFFISFILFLITLGLSSFIIKIVFGSLYLPSINILRILSFLIILMPITSVHLYYLLSIKKSKAVAKLLIFSTIVNIILMYTFVSYMLKYGNIAATYGASIAMIISQLIYLFGLRLILHYAQKKV
jgi:stage V sporulation protein B